MAGPKKFILNITQETGNVVFYCSMLQPHNQLEHHMSLGNTVDQMLISREHRIAISYTASVQKNVKHLMHRRRCLTVRCRVSGCGFYGVKLLQNVSYRCHKLFSFYRQKYIILCVCVREREMYISK